MNCLHTARVRCFVSHKLVTRGVVSVAARYRCAFSKVSGRHLRLSPIVPPKTRFFLSLKILITLVYSAELVSDFSYTNFTVSYRDALDRLRVHLNILSCFDRF